MLVIQFLILYSTVMMASGLDVLKYPEFIKHLEKLDQNGYAIDHEKKVDKSDYDNQKSLYKIIKEFEMKITSLIKESTFLIAKLGNRKEKEMMDDHYIFHTI